VFSLSGRDRLLKVLSVSLLATFGAIALSGAAEGAVTPVHRTTASPTSILSAFERAWADVRAYTATITLFEKQDSRMQRAVYEYSFSKPSHATLHVVSGTSAGDTLEWNGGSTVVAHRGSGFLSVFKKTFSLHDKATTTIRGSSVDELSFGAIFAHAEHVRGALRLGPTGTVNGVATQSLTLIPTSASDAGYTREVVDLSTSTHLPVRVLGYHGKMLVRQVDFSQVHVTSQR